MGALAKQTALVNYAKNMAGSRARSMAAPPKRKHEACAANMVQGANVKQSIAAQMRKREADIVGSTGGQLDTAKQSHPATPLQSRASLSAPCTAPTGSAASGGAPKMPTTAEEGCAARTTLKCCYALLQTAPTKLLLDGFARSMVQMGSARLAIARLPQRAKEGVSGTAAATRKCAK